MVWIIVIIHNVGLGNNILRLVNRSRDDGKGKGGRDMNEEAKMRNADEPKRKKK